MTGQVTAAEVEAVARECIAVVDSELNALAAPAFEPALHADPSGALDGVPFAIKDSGPVASGVPFSLGSRSITAARSPVDSTIMVRFREAGLVTLAQTTAPEYGLSFATESKRYGATRNPWNLDRGVGGSSGGAAALVAAGAVPLAHANDAGGSIRIPASSCGLVGLKPSRGRTPSGPLVGEAGFGLTVEFAVSRTVRDSALLLDCVSAHAPGEKYSMPTPLSRFVDAPTTDPGRLRIGVTTAAAPGSFTDPQVTRATVMCGELLEWIGHELDERGPTLATSDLLEAEMLAVYSSGAAILSLPHRPDEALLEAVSRQVLRETASAGVVDVERALAAQNRVTRGVADFFSHHDLLLTPTMAVLPLAIGALDYDDPDCTVRQWLQRLLEVSPFVSAFNISGNPAVSIPLAQSREGLPIGVQLVAASGREDLLLAVAAQLEQAAPWSDRLPLIYAD